MTIPPKNASILQGSLICLLLVALSWHKILNADIWLHLRAGEAILEQARVPREETYSFTAFGRPWIDLHWGYQLVVASIHRIAGLVGIQVLHAAFLMIAYAVIFREILRHRMLAPAWLFAGLATLASYERILCRPELLTLIFLGITWLLSEKMIRGQRPSVWWLGGAVIWANVQGLFVLGPLLLAARGIALLVDRRRIPDRIAPSAPRWHLIGATGMLLAALLTPYGWHGLALPFRLFMQVSGGSFYQTTIAELRSPFSGTVTPVLFGITAVVAIASWLIDRRRRVADLVPMLLFLFLAISARRNLMLFAFVSLPPTMIALSHLANRLPRRVGFALDGLSCLALLLMIVAVLNGTFYYTAGSKKELGLGISSTQYPVAAADHLKTREPGGRVFNVMGDGHYVGWALGPTWKVSSDGRTEVYGEQIGRAVNLAVIDPNIFQRLRQRYGFRHLLIDVSREVGRRFVAARLSEGDWRLTYADYRGAVLVERQPRDPSGSGVEPDIELDAASLSLPQPRSFWRWRWGSRFPFAYSYGARVQFALGRNRAGVLELQRAAFAFPYSAKLFSDLGAGFLLLGEPGLAVQAAQHALELDDGDRLARTILRQAVPSSR